MIPPAGQRSLVPAGQRSLVPAGQRTIRMHNLGLVVSALGMADGGAVGRAALAQRTGLTKATVAAAVDDLIGAGLLVETAVQITGPGRPSRPVRFDPAAPLALGLECNVDHNAVCLIDLTGRVRDYRRQPVDNRPLTAVRALAGLSAFARDSLGQTPGVLGAQLALPGVISPDGQVLRAPNLTFFAGTRPGQILADLLPVPVAPGPIGVGNEANSAALAWLRSSSQPADASVPEAACTNFLYLSGDVGVGAGIVMGGSLFTGLTGFAGELGHVVIAADGPDCVCGGRGCLEQYAGLQPLLKTAGQPSLAAVAAALATGDETALIAVSRVATALGVGLASALNVLDVPTVVLGGSFAQLFDHLAPTVRQELDRRVLFSQSGGGSLRRSDLGAEAAVSGAAGSVLDRLLSDPELLLTAGHSLRRAGV